MTSRRHLLGAALIGALPLTGCGFRLRGSYSTPFRTLYLQMPENSYLAVRLRQELLAGSDVTIVNTPSEAEAILELLSDSRSRDVLSINDTGRAREYEITLSLSFRVSNPSGIDYMEAVTLTASRDLTYSESDFLSREKEEAFLYRDMEADLVNQLMYDKVDAVVVDAGGRLIREGRPAPGLPRAIREGRTSGSLLASDGLGRLPRRRSRRRHPCRSAPTGLHRPSGARHERLGGLVAPDDGRRRHRHVRRPQDRRRASLHGESGQERRARHREVS